MAKEKTKAEANLDEKIKKPQQSPVDALSRTPEDLAIEAANSADAKVELPVEKPASPIKRFLRRINLYLLIFALLMVGASIYTAVNYLNARKVAPDPTIASQELTEDALKQLANTNATVGNTSQTLTIQGSAVIAGQTLMRGNLNVAGNLQTGGSIQAPSLTISGTANLGTAQANSLQVASNVAIQGSTTMRDLSVSGSSTFNGLVTANEINVTRLTISGNGALNVPNHVSFNGPSPSRGPTGPGLGSGGSASVSGSDSSGTVNVSTGNNPAAGCFVQVNFARAYDRQPRIMITPVDPAAGQTQYYVTRTTTSFSICAASPAPANKNFAFDFFVAG